MEREFSRVVRHQSLADGTTVLAGFGRESLGYELLIIAVFEDPQLATLEENKTYGPAIVSCIITLRKVKYEQIQERKRSYDVSMLRVATIV